MQKGLEAQETLALAIDGAGSCNHVPQEDLDRIGSGVAIAAWLDDAGYGPEHSCTVLVALRDGFAVITEGEDSSGHGCQCSADVGFYLTHEEAVRLGLGQEERNEYLRESWPAMPAEPLEQDR